MQRCTIMYSGNHEPKRVAGVEANSSLPEDMPPPAPRTMTPPLVDRLPWACVTCGRWVPHVERLHLDSGLFHDTVECMSGERYEALVARYACVCDDVPRVTPEEKREANRIAVALEPGEYTSDDLDRIVAGRDRP